jgi:RNA polymerase sigma factor (sigma-70 family)
MKSEDISSAFQTTRWSLVRLAGGPDEAAAAEAIAQLCEAYWHPLYAFFRRSGKSPHDAEDLTQELFVQLLRRETLAAAKKDKGRLRSFLLTCTRNLLCDVYDRSMAKKRRSPAPTTEEFAAVENWYAREPVDNLSPDRLFQRRWALNIVDVSLRLLKQEFADQGKETLFASLRPFLGFGPDPNKTYEEIAASTGITVGSLKTHVFRMRQRWRDLLLAEVGKTLHDPTPDEIRAELQELLGFL